MALFLPICEQIGDPSLSVPLQGDRADLRLFPNAVHIDRRSAAITDLKACSQQMN